MRFSPCTDRPEVLEMYATGIRQLHGISCGMLDLIVMRTNDSGTGFCWTHLYDQPNGPEACRSIGAVPRAAKFMQTCREAVADAGGEAEFYLQGPRIAGGGAGVRSFLDGVPDGCGCYEHGGNSVGGKRILTANPENFPTYPLRGIPAHVEVLERLSQGHKRGFPNLAFFTRPTMYGNDWEGDEKITRTIASFNKSPCDDFLSKVEMTKELAEDLYGTESVGDVVSAWWDIYHAGEILKKNETGMNMIFIGCLANRWLTRPFVLFPEELTDEERSHYRPHLFEANEEHEHFDLLNTQGIRPFDGMKHLSYFLKHLDAATGKYGDAREALARSHSRKGKNHEELGRQVSALEMLDCFLKTIRNCVGFQIRVENAKASIASDPNSRASEALLAERAEIRNIIRSEMDNAARLETLLEGDGLQLIDLAPTEEEETPFLLGPDIREDLRRKRSIMMGKWPDIDRLFTPPNI